MVPPVSLKSPGSLCHLRSAARGHSPSLLVSPLSPLPHLVSSCLSHSHRALAFSCRNFRSPGPPWTKSICAFHTGLRARRGFGAPTHVRSLHLPGGPTSSGPLLGSWPVAPGLSPLHLHPPPGWVFRLIVDPSLLRVL